MKINTEKIEKEIAILQKKAQANEKVEIVFTTDESEIVFSGHVWGSSCWYTIDDLRRNGDFKVVISPDGDYATVGIEVSLTQEELKTLWKLTNRIEVSRAAAALGRKGGQSKSPAKKKASQDNMKLARAAVSLTKEQKVERARNAVNARWAKRDKKES